MLVSTAACGGKPAHAPHSQCTAAYVVLQFHDVHYHRVLFIMLLNTFCCELTWCYHVPVCHTCTCSCHNLTKMHRLKMMIAIWGPSHNLVLSIDEPLSNAYTAYCKLCRQQELQPLAFCYKNWGIKFALNCNCKNSELLSSCVLWQVHQVVPVDS